MKEHEMISAITLRDFFASQAMQGALAGIATRAEVIRYSELAGLAYEVADAMMEARDEEA
jgi:hypothetical protein